MKTSELIGYLNTPGVDDEIFTVLVNDYILTVKVKKPGLCNVSWYSLKTRESLEFNRLVYPDGIPTFLDYLNADNHEAINWESEKPKNGLVSESGYVYFIQSEQGGLIKIGFTAYKPEVRLQQIQNMSPVPLKVIAFLRGDRAKEAELHMRFRDIRTYGEWFKPEPNLLAYIAKIKS